MSAGHSILSRILRSLSSDGEQVFTRLCNLSPRDLQSLLMAVHAQRAAAVLPMSPRAKRALQALDDPMRSPLHSEFSDVEVIFDLGRSEGLGYYTGPCLRITAEDASHLRLPLVDGGYLDWTATLLADPKEQMLSTGIGPDLAALRFRAQRSETAER